MIPRRCTGDVQIEHEQEAPNGEIGEMNDKR
jgi:hypothetical protein